MNQDVRATVVISTKNEQAAIVACIKSVSAFDEVIVVDSNSVDDTAKLASSLGASVVNFTWDGKYPKKKQWCLDNLSFRNEWVFFVDADESPSTALISELRKVLETSTASAFDIPVTYRFMGSELRHGHVVVKRALVRVGHVEFPEIQDLLAPGMGELEGHYQPITDGIVSKTASRLIHDDPDPIRSWVDRHNKYSDWEAYLRVNPAVGAQVRGRRTRQGRLFQKAPLKWVSFFLYCYVFRLGFLDGKPGFRYAALLSWYYLLIEIKVSEQRHQRH